MRQPGAAELDVLVGVCAMALRDMEEHVLGGDARLEPAREIVADGLADAEPGLARRHRVEHVGRADAARRAVEGAAAAGVRIRADQHRAGQRIGVLGDDHMADPGIAPDIVHAGDAEALGECAAGTWCAAAPRGRSAGTM